jgi:hypothetical protein
MVLRFEDAALNYHVEHLIRQGFSDLHRLISSERLNTQHLICTVKPSSPLLLKRDVSNHLQIRAHAGFCVRDKLDDFIGRVGSRTRQARHPHHSSQSVSHRFEPGAMESTYNPPLSLTIIGTIFIGLTTLVAAWITFDIIVRRGWETMMAVM